MAEKLSTPAPPRPPPRIVGVVHSPGALRAALALGEDGGPDLLELRVDAFAAAPETLDELLRAAPRPFLLTVRDPREGGTDPALTPARRRALFERFLPAAALVDLELRALAQLPALAAVAAAARERGLPVIASFHDFENTPPLRRLRALARRARELRADIFKVATRVQTPADLAHLLLLLDAARPPAAALPVAAMGMGKTLGRASRLALAAAGSVLNYGSLDTAIVPGQWPAARLRERLGEMKAEG